MSPRTHGDIQTAYFVFLLETVQTALTGADVYYWFMAGFGDFEGLNNLRFSPIDIPTMDAFISLIVQVFLCYRIWTLNKRLWWLCTVMAVVSLTLLTFCECSSHATIYNSFLLLRQLGRYGVDSR